MLLVSVQGILFNCTICVAQKFSGVLRRKALDCVGSVIFAMISRCILVDIVTVYYVALCCCADAYFL